MVRAPKSLSMMFVTAAFAYGVAFWAMVTLDADSAWSRFEALSASEAYGRAVGHGDQAVALSLQDGKDGEAVQKKQLALAEAHRQGGVPERAIELYHTVLDSPLGSQMTEPERAAIENKIAGLSLSIGRPIEAATLIAAFVDASGDAVARRELIDKDSHEAVLLGYADAALNDFTDALPPVVERELIQGDEAARLRIADALTSLGGYYARTAEGDYAAAGLLATAYRTRTDILGADHADTVHTALLLAPVYERIDRITDAEQIYLTAFHAQERAKGSNNPELSLYIRLLSEVYRRQGRITEAEALNVHMRTLFRDAFGARRYAPNQARDRTTDINRPVSRDFPLPSAYVPPDLVRAELYSIPLSKPPAVEEMSIRAALIDQQTSMPKLLADLIGECRSEQERLSLRSGYRSFSTQSGLYARSRNGQVAAPGTSEHQLGLAVDIDVNGRFMRSTDRAFQCFEAQAWRHGFILTYPRGNRYLESADSFEPWHWRFVGPQTALLYRETGPLGFPQEFLAALPCYEERALAGLFVRAGEQDVCLANVLGDDQLADAPATEEQEG